MKKLPLAALAVSCLPLSACVSQAAIDLHNEYVAEYQQTIQTCDNPGECKAMWEAAQIWVIRNAAYKIQNQTDVLIQTYSSTDSGIDATVLKDPVGDGSYHIRIRVTCGRRMADGGCEPHAGAAAVDFNATMKATKEAYRKRGATTL